MQGVKFNREPDFVATYHVFLSSAGEMQPLRQRIDELITESINPPLRDAVRAQLLLQMWERAQAQQQHPGRDVNDIFVERALNSHAALGLFRQQLRPGTLEEIQALVQAREQDPDNSVHLSILRFECETGQTREAELDAFFGWLSEHNVLYDDTMQFDSDKAWHDIVKVLVAYALAAYADAQTRRAPDVL